MKKPEAPDIATQKADRPTHVAQQIRHLFGLRHGREPWPAIGGVVDGCPPLLKLAEATSSPGRKRRPANRIYHQRQRTDQVGSCRPVRGLTTGTPVSLVIENQISAHRDYEAIATRFVPATPT